MRYGKNCEGYSDPTASIAIGRVTREEKLKRRRAEEKKNDERNHQTDGGKSKK